MRSLFADSLRDKRFRLGPRASLVKDEDGPGLWYWPGVVLEAQPIHTVAVRNLIYGP